MRTVEALPQVHEAAAQALLGLIASGETPFVVRGLVREWPLVAAGLASAQEARSYLSAHARAVDLPYSVAAPDQGGKLFYDAQMAVNFQMASGRLPDVLARFDAPGDQPTVYLGSIDIHRYFDGLHQANHVPAVPDDALASIWIGNATRIAAHNDHPRNLACCAVGQRRFTLFPPDQFANLYLGPLDVTPAGRPVSLVDFDNPDFSRHPRYREALAHAQVVDLQPGDALFIPSLWYHHVDATAPFNVLVNYWWRDTPRYLGQPQTAMTHAIMAIRDLPAAERAVWRDMFEHYVFSGGEDARAHVPQAGQGILAPIDARTAQRIQQFLLRSLSQ
ncbi:cupin-like domain-containing protein [Novosphingobium sp.]|uniref:cupin-like domain-containing protein n=1 Tax=Novosphingobium sp. TaxID=1874826 RepID=UPI002611451D|nr:cupin-like domain-containing protein [Novosphingobium sp.]